MSKPVRVRFAPSPTGMLHIGGVRSALFNWLWARHNHGAFILRLEDTDRARLVVDAATQIHRSLDQLGLTPDEGPVQGGDYGPYVQSQRLKIYAEHANTLTDSGDLYPCWCSAERLAELRTTAQKSGTAFKYDRYCLQDGQQKSPDEPHVLRFRIPETPAVIKWDDAVRGTLAFKIADLEDFVAIKSDGYPTYQFANVVDDHLMEISHVMRADEWIPSTPKHLLLFAAFGWEPPVYAHMPAILGPNGGKKLSKRDGAQSVAEYVEEGYLPEALLSFLATLGWNDSSTQETFSVAELIEKFSLDRIQKSPAKLDKERLTWTNGLFIRAMPTDELLPRCEHFWPESAKDSTDEYKIQILSLVQERLKYLAELPELTDFFFADPLYDADMAKMLRKQSDSAESILNEATTWLSDTEFTIDALETRLRALAVNGGYKTGTLFGLVRIAATGRTAAPGLFETLTALGKETALRRLHAAIDSLLA